MRPNLNLKQRMSPFLERGMLDGLPNQWQLWQGTLEMTPYVLSPDVTAERHYRRSVFANPLVRQFFLLRLQGWDHLSTGTGLRVRLASICRHLMLTWHEGMPAYDLQIVQTHPGGLAELRRRVLGAMQPQSAEDQRVRNQAERLFPDPDAYFSLFVEDGGWIDRAEAFDYPSAVAEAGGMPPEFYSLVGFVDYCRSLPERPADVGYLRLPVHIARLVGRRFRGGDDVQRRWLRTA